MARRLAATGAMADYRRLCPGEMAKSSKYPELRHAEFPRLSDR